MRNARSRANPYESISNRFFQNRAALKMANIDAVFNFSFTNPTHRNGVGFQDLQIWSEILFVSLKLIL
jgi:hypothetical protein